MLYDQILSVSDTALEDFFDAGTEYADGFLWAGEALLGDDEGYGFGYLLLFALSHRARSEMALERLGQKELPSAYNDDLVRLRKLHGQAEEQWERFWRDRKDEVQGALLPGGAIQDKLEQAWTGLRQVRSLAAEQTLLGNDAVSDELREAASSFLLLIADLQWLSVQPGNDVARLPAFSGFQERMFHLEEHFRNCFDIFALTNDLLEGMRRLEACATFWWLERTPRLDEAHAALTQYLTDERVQALGSALRSTRNFSLDSCPDPQLLNAYALHELDHERSRKVKSHVHGCAQCLEVVLGVRDAVADDAGEEYVADRLPDYLEQAFSEQIVCPAWQETRLNRFQDWDAFSRQLERASEGILRLSRRVFSGPQRFITTLLAADFASDALPLQASEQSVDFHAKRVVMGHEGIMDVQLVSLRRTNWSCPEDGVEIGFYLPDEHDEDDVLEFHFGWKNSEGSVRVLEPKGMARNGRFVAAKFSLPSSCCADGEMSILLVTEP